MRFMFKTDYEDDIKLFPHGGYIVTYGVLLAFLVVAPFILSSYLVSQLVFVFIYATVGVGLMILTGFTGQGSLGHAAFLAIGAYTTAYMQARGYPFEVYFPAAALLTGIVGQLAEMLKLSNHLPPTGNTLVSNVPGPREYLYIKGARLEELHPISTLPAGNLLNITLFSYAGQLYFGLIATDELPNLERLSAYVAEAFTELEQSVFDAHQPIS